MKSAEIIRIIPYLLLTLIFIDSSCNVRRTNRAESRSKKQVTEDISLQTHNISSFNSKHLVLVNDSANHEYQVKIFPLDTFSFSLEKGFKGKAASIEFAGSVKQVKASLESTVLSGENRNETVEGRSRETKDREITSSKSIRTSRISWWVIVGGLSIALLLIWRLGIPRNWLCEILILGSWFL